MSWDVRQGDVIEVLREYPDETFNAVLTDPPYGLGKDPDMADVLGHWLNDEEYDNGTGGFMNAEWDSFVPGPLYWREVYRVLKPGAVLMAFGGTRTADLLGVALRLAGFEKFDEIDYLCGGLPPQIDWITGSGFPKSMAIDKAIDKEAGAKREVVGRNPNRDGRRPEGYHEGWARPWQEDQDSAAHLLTAPATPDAVTFAGYGTALKPAHEIILCFRRPRTGTYAQMAVEHGTGALWVDGGRVGVDDGDWKGKGGGGVHPRWRGQEMNNIIYGKGLKTTGPDHSCGRWPANLILDDAAAEALDEQSGVRKSTPFVWAKDRQQEPTIYGGGKGIPFDRQAMTGGYADTGGASRYFQHCSYEPGEVERFRYCAKAGRRQRDMGLPDGQRSHHPCVKPLTLCAYLAKLLRPPEPYLDDAKLLCCFAGSGSEMIGAVLAGWRNVVGIEKEAEHVEVAEARLAWWSEAHEAMQTDDVKALLDYEPLPMFAEAS